MSEKKVLINLKINKKNYQGLATTRIHLADFMREELGLTGTHVGCEHGVCGACTVLADGVSVRGCLMLAVQAEGMELTTVEGLAVADELHPIQQAFHQCHALQCGFCTPGILMTVKELLDEHPNPTEELIRDVLSGHLCRCTGYQNIVEAVKVAARQLQEQRVEND